MDEMQRGTELLGRRCSHRNSDNVRQQKPESVCTLPIDQGGVEPRFNVILSSVRSLLLVYSLHTYVEQSAPSVQPRKKEAAGVELWFDALL